MVNSCHSYRSYFTPISCSIRISNYQTLFSLKPSECVEDCSENEGEETVTIDPETKSSNI